MSADRTGPAGPAGVVEERLSRLFLGIVLVEILAIVGLYWMGVHFAS